MDAKGRKFGSGPRELGGGADLINKLKLWPHHEFFCKRSIPLSISETHYLDNVVGDTEIRKGNGMQFDQLIQKTSHLKERNALFCPFDVDVLSNAFHIRESIPVQLPSVEKRFPTACGRPKSATDKERKHKKRRDKNKKDRVHRDHKKREHHHKQKKIKI